ncbi:hypothetical protein ACHQM5_021541 [Ranunculus cassubicifolius]
MEAMGSSSGWSYEANADELKNMLLYTTLELETVRKEAKDYMKRNEENVKQLLYFLNLACQQRDEARGQLQRLMNKLMPVSPREIGTVLPMIQPESPITALRGNSGLTMSDSMSYGSSPVDSLLDIVSSPDVPSINMADSSNVGIPMHSFCPTPMAMASSVSTSGVPKTDRALEIIDQLVKGKTLPQKGKLLQTVIEAGPLLTTVMLSGDMPKWKNPPNERQPIQMPPFSLNRTMNVKSISSRSHPVQSMFSEMPPVLNSPGTRVSPDVSSGLLTGKRQRCQ